ncbi:hypothetical protein F2P81_000532 [Scophthalmus maximus]|uniref:Uncharacterized protein n=1 Tax=Scophthalmus maximus TaxID=52904 RepID=A0A6A4TPU7_SCOMX|nr:hypothetical protein F2P81_000532 [Scophthalmus maximus]
MMLTLPLVNPRSQKTKVLTRVIMLNMSPTPSKTGGYPPVSTDHSGSSDQQTDVYVCKTLTCQLSGELCYTIKESPPLSSEMACLTYRKDAAFASHNRTPVPGWSRGLAASQRCLAVPRRRGIQ